MKEEQLRIDIVGLTGACSYALNCIEAGEYNKNCVSFSNLLSRFYQMPELSVKAGNLTLTDIPAFKTR